MNVRITAALCTFALATHSLAIADDESTEEKSFWYDDGLNLESAGGNYTAHMELRAQLRYSNLDFDNDFANPNADSNELRMNRLRFKWGGKLGASWLDYYTEYDFVRPDLLDLWVAPKVGEKLGFRIGQYKVPYNRERFDSSGKQQFAERSIVTPPFTLDRQIGVTAMGRLFKNQAFDSNYFVGAFFGNGRAGARDDDGKPLVFGRWQWNIFRRVLPFSQSDITRHQQHTASLSVGAATNRSKFTRFSSGGGGELPGYPAGEDGQFDTDQAMVEFAYMYKGLSIQSEFHWKNIDDRINRQSTDLNGFYFDTGYFFSEMIDGFPEPLELAVRYAQVDPDDSVAEPETTEVAVGGNWFFYGHRNKLTLDVTRNTGEDALELEHSWGIRVQWDVSF